MIDVQQLQIDQLLLALKLVSVVYIVAVAACLIMVGIAAAVEYARYRNSRSCLPTSPQEPLTVRHTLR